LGVRREDRKLRRRCQDLLWAALVLTARQVVRIETEFALGN
jgi:hypothetical protein